MLKTLTTHHVVRAAVVVDAGVAKVQVDDVVVAAAHLLRRPVVGAGESRAIIVHRYIPPLAPESAQCTAGAITMVAIAVKLLHSWQTVAGLFSAVCSSIRPVQFGTPIIYEPALKGETVLNDFPLATGRRTGDGHFTTRPRTGELHHPVSH